MNKEQAEAAGVQVVRYGIKINKEERKPHKRVTYLYDAVGKKPARMRYKKGYFDYGDWQQAEFVKDNYPVLLGKSGKEIARLEPNDYSKTIEGSTLDHNVLCISTTGINTQSIEEAGVNFMAAFKGGWLRQYETDTDEYIIWSNVQYDENYNAWHRTAPDGEIREGFYRHMYTPTCINGAQRSLSGHKPDGNKGAMQQREECRANGIGWDMGQWSEWNYISCLLKIIAKSDDDQKAYGYGNCDSWQIQKSGSCDKAGQFWGSKSGNNAVKVFHTENMWGNTFERLLGLVDYNGTIKAKMFGEYNFTGEGYEEVLKHYRPQYGFVKGTAMSCYGRFAIDFRGDEKSYACCYSSYWNDGVNVALGGGGAGGGARCGSGYVHLGVAAGAAEWSIAAGLSYKMPKAA
ncbi:MAG: hypothetical protein EOM18_02615 [Clostridia bacterium]|nr:hypothetical protein [Clostridia bacterium]